MVFRPQKQPHKTNKTSQHAPEMVPHPAAVQQPPRKTNNSQHAPEMMPHPAAVGRRPALTDASFLIFLQLSSLRGLRRLAVVSMASRQAPSHARVISAILRVRQRLNCIRNDNTPTTRFHFFWCILNHECFQTKRT